MTYKYRQPYRHTNIKIQTETQTDIHIDGWMD